MIEIWAESAKFNATSKKLTDNGIMILKKVWFSDHEIQERFGQVDCEENGAEIQNIENKNYKSPINTTSMLTQEEI